MFEEVVKHYHNFPKEGIDFIDVLPFMGDKRIFNEAIREIDKMCTAPTVATIEARGFIFAAPLLMVSDHVEKVVPIRKKGKLPYGEGDLVRVEIMKEYGSDELFYRRSDFASAKVDDGYIDVAIMDDLLATGGTAMGVAESLNNQIIDGHRLRVKEFVFLVELPELNGREVLEKIAPVRSLMCINEWSD